MGDSNALPCVVIIPSRWALFPLLPDVGDSYPLDGSNPALKSQRVLMGQGHPSKQPRMKVPTTTSPASIFRKRPSGHRRVCLSIPVLHLLTSLSSTPSAADSSPPSFITSDAISLLQIRRPSRRNHKRPSSRRRYAPAALTSPPSWIPRLADETPLRT